MFRTGSDLNVTTTDFPVSDTASNGLSSLVYFGTVKKDITIIPDYLLERDGKYAWILDAKSPTENIDTGKNVEQAYSYKIGEGPN